MNQLKVSISDKPYSGRFKLISEQNDWQISDGRNLKKVEAKKVIFALRDIDETKLEFYFQAYDLGFIFFDKPLEMDPEKPSKLILEGSIANSFIDKQQAPNNTIKFETIMLEQINMDIGVSNRLEVIEQLSLEIIRILWM